MIAATTWRRRKLAARQSDALGGAERYVDMGAALYVVCQDDSGIEVLPGKPRVRALRRHAFGGIWDSALQRFIGPSANPVRWLCSPEQEELLLHGDELANKLLVYGAEGAGKTEVLAMYALIRALEFAARGIFGHAGATAPTGDRLFTLLRKLRSKMPESWYRYRTRERELALACGITFQLRSTTRHSEAVGSPIQGYDWLFAVSDEIQDSIDANEDIETRGRAAPEGRYRRLNTATAKDSTSWRNFRDGLRANPLWEFRQLQGPSNPFVPQAHWLNLRATLSRRGYQRRVLALDVGPERATYPSFSRERHLRPIPDDARDVTANILGREFGLLIGHDPGELFDVSIMLRAYELPGRPLPVWFVVGELTTEQTTSAKHAAQLLNLLREQYGMEWPGTPKALIRCDPHGQSERKPDKTVYTQFRNAGLAIRSAQFRPSGTGAGNISKDARIETVDSCLETADGTTRLFIALAPGAIQEVDGAWHGTPVAPRLVESLEMSERDELGRAEVQKKDRSDLSHWTAALGYALWPYERPRLEALSRGRLAA